MDSDLAKKGPYIVHGMDGNSELDNPSKYVAKLNASRVDIVVDYEHSTALLKGQKAPAAGWLKDFKENDGEVWGRVEWTEEAAQLLSKKHYRYISPHFTHDEIDGQVLNLWSVGLVNSPALNMEAIAMQMVN